MKITLQKERQTNSPNCPGNKLSLFALICILNRCCKSVVPSKKLFTIIGILVIGAFGICEAGAQEPQQQVRFVPDVIGQFNALTTRPDALGFHIGDGPDPSLCRHHQAVIRTEASDGTPYFIVSRSGPPRDFCAESIDPIHVGNPIANLYIVRMGSRDKNGERMRSNRLRRNLTTSLTPPDEQDRVVRSIKFDGSTADWPHYDHPGGMQQVGNIVALGVEFPARIFVENGPDGQPVYVQEDPSAPDVVVMFMDVTDPENPQVKSRFIATQDEDAIDEEPRAGVVALTPCGAGRVGVPCATGHYLMAITGGTNNNPIHFYESTSNDLGSPDLSWTLIYIWHKEELQGGQEWPDNGHQTFNFLREQNLNGALYVAGSRGRAFGSDLMDLYRVDLDGNGADFKVRLTWASKRHMISHPAGEGDSVGVQLADFRAGSAFHVTPSGELIFYATEHDNDGPEGSNARGSVKMGEWRHMDMVRPNSPTLRPSVAFGGPYVVDEGASVALSAVGQSPITKAWVQLFEDPAYDKRFIVVDYNDREKDNFDDFEQLDPEFPLDGNGATDEASSLRWFAPVGCTIRVNQHSFGDSNFPGALSKTLFGSVHIGEAFDLDAEGIGNEMSSVQFFPIGSDNFPDCRAYYSAPIHVAWDFDLDGVFETVAGTPNFSAEALDGPSVRSVPVRAQHSTDPTALGQSAPANVDIQIRNVSPSITSFNLIDPVGFKVGVDVPFAFVNLEYAAAGSFTDPGKPDHQAAALNFGDSSIVLSNSFELFSDAFGGVTGQLKQTHIYRTAGTYPLRLNLSDDDGGVTEAAVSIKVVSPLDALQSIVNEIDHLLSTATNRQVISALRDARDKLASNNSSAAKNGAISKLAGGDLVGALVKIKETIDSLQQAEAAGGGNLSQLKYLLGLTGMAIAQGAYLDAVAAVGTPSSGETVQLQRILQDIMDGHGQLVSGEYAAAIDQFKDAVGRSLSLL